MSPEQAEMELKFGTDCTAGSLLDVDEEDLLLILIIIIIII
jgi:hypothetical protein